MSVPSVPVCRSLRRCSDLQWFRDIKSRQPIHLVIPSVRTLSGEKAPKRREAWNGRFLLSSINSLMFCFVIWVLETGNESEHQGLEEIELTSRSFSYRWQLFPPLILPLPRHARHPRQHLRAPTHTMDRSIYVTRAVCQTITRRQWVGLLTGRLPCAGTDQAHVPL